MYYLLKEPNGSLIIVDERKFVVILSQKKGSVNYCSVWKKGMNHSFSIPAYTIAKDNDVNKLLEIGLIDAL